MRARAGDGCGLWCGCGCGGRESRRLPACELLICRKSSIDVALVLLERHRHGIFAVAGGRVRGAWADGVVRVRQLRLGIQAPTGLCTSGLALCPCLIAYCGEGGPVDINLSATGFLDHQPRNVHCPGRLSFIDAGALAALMDANDRRVVSRESSSCRRHGQRSQDARTRARARKPGGRPGPREIRLAGVRVPGEQG
jgi:hypothetical protein